MIPLATVIHTAAEACGGKENNTWPVDYVNRMQRGEGTCLDCSSQCTHNTLGSFTGSVVNGHNTSC